MADSEIIIDQSQVAALLRDPGLRDAMVDAARERIVIAQARAPKLTGLGAASIHPEAILDGAEWIVKVSWTQERYYMVFHEEGDRYMRPHPFLAPAFEF
jgi:hypothetical protein